MGAPYTRPRGIVYVPTVTLTGYNPGDLVSLSAAGAAVPAGEQVDQGSLLANQLLFAGGFLGVCNGKKLATDAGVQELPVIVGEDVRMPCASTTFKVGDWVGAVEVTAGDELENQKVAKVTDRNLAIGVVTVAGTGLTSVWFRPFSKLEGLESAGLAPIAIGASRTIDPSEAGRTFLFSAAAGSVATLPAAVGSGAKFRFAVSVLATSNSHKVQVANANDVMRGVITGARVDSGNAVLGFAAASDSDTITLNRTTTGSVSLGEWLEIEDVAAGVFMVRGVLSATGAAFATPYSAAV